MSEPTQYVSERETQETSLPADGLTERRSWIVGVTSLLFIVLQSACTAVMAISGVRVLIGLSALAAAAGLHTRATGFHSDAIRIPMMVLAVGGSIVNLYVIWRIRSLRARASSQWRVQPVSARKELHPEFTSRHHRLALDVARLEWAYIEAYDCAALPPLGEAGFAALTGDSRLFLQPHLQLLALSYPVDELVLAVHQASPR